MKRVWLTAFSSCRSPPDHAAGRAESPSVRRRPGKPCGDRVLDSIPRLTEPARGVGNAGVPSQHFVPHIFFGLDPMMVSTIILCVTYGIIIWDKLNRAIVALLGASVMVLVGALDQSEALKGIDWNTIGLLTGMMILVSISRRS